MFTGLVQHVGKVASMRTVPFGVELSVDVTGWSHRPVPGESIAVDGCCLTVRSGASDAGPGHLCFDVVRQTLDVTTLGDRGPGDGVNLEHAVTPSSLLGGHIVQGHVDGVAEVVAVTDDARERRLRIAPPPTLLDAIVEKGSVCVDGVSLTIAAVDDVAFEVALIPTTLVATTLGRAAVGTRHNVETDLVAKTVVHWLARHRAGAATDGAGRGSR